MQRIVAILRREIGLDAESIGSSVIERTLRLRMKHHGLKSSEDYNQLLAESPEELSALIEAVVVTETWFMRGREAFAAFGDLVLNVWLPRNPDRVLRVLSLPCSSGEEPFSMVMSLLDAGLPADRFEVVAVDISTTALERAALAVYGRNSFRGKHLEFRDRFFVPVEDGFALSPDVQRLVSFQRDNLLRVGFNAGGAPFDFIFCRNLLIYFDRATQVLALEKLRRLLAPDGFLFVGSAEMPIVCENGFSSANIPLSFASRLSARVAEGGKRRAEGRRQKAEVGGLISDIRPLASHIGLETLDASGADEGLSSLRLARQFADAGQLAEAERLCAEHIRGHDTCAEAYYLMGLVKDAADAAEAISFYRKAIYLEPNHYEALIHAALLLEKAGDVVRADAFRRRAVRSGRKSEIRGQKSEGSGLASDLRIPTSDFGTEGEGVK